MNEKETSVLYTYCLRYDTGAAPNPFWGLCTLVICKPKIRRAAKKGDWVVGTGSVNSPLGNISDRIVYAMKITEKMSLEEYDRFCRVQCPNKIPEWNSKDYRRCAGDCIYDFSKGDPPKMRKGVHTEQNKETDLGGKFALLSSHFYYFGNQPKKLPENLQDIIHPRSGYRSNSNTPYVDAFISWIEGLGLEPNILHGKPQLKDIICDPDFASKCSKYH